MTPTMKGELISAGDRCPSNGKNRCAHRGYFGRALHETSLPYCNKYKEFLVQGKTKQTQMKCKACLEAMEDLDDEG